MIPAFHAQLITCMLNSLTDNSVEKVLKLEGRTLLVTLGNSLRGDDGVGPFIGESIKRKAEDFKVINAYTTPENIVSPVVDFKPDKLIVIDAANFGGLPGEVRVIPLDKISKYRALSTHSFPLEIIFGIILEDTKASLSILGVQAKKMDYVEGLSSEVEKAALNIIDYYNRIQ